MSPINSVIFYNLAIFTSVSSSGGAFIISEMSLSSFNDVGKFIPPRLITYIAYKIFHYCNNTNHLIRFPPIISFYLINETITLVISLFSNKIVLIIKFICYYNSTKLNYPSYSKVNGLSRYVSTLLN